MCPPREITNTSANISILQSDGRDEGSVWNPPLAINQDTKTRSYSALVIISAHHKQRQGLNLISRNTLVPTPTGKTCMLLLVPR